MSNPVILDVTCATKSMWFNKKHPLALYCDERKMDKRILWEGRGKRLGQKRYVEIAPDKIIDFRKLDFPDNSFKLVVFDPPHIKNLGNTSWLFAKYGRLENTWAKDLQQGFGECMRVLDDYGTLVFKWNEESVSTADVLKAINYKPLFGHTTSKNGKTIWMCFMKIGSEESD